MSEGLPIHIVASITAGLATAIVTSPVDVIKTRIMNERVSAQLVYTSSFNTFVKILKYEGAAGFYKGFIPNWMRIGPHTIITFLIFEQLRKMVGLAPI